ncbi:MAG: ATPase [Thermoplasmata archaeon]|nr:MAG: ATPase [Thermoplasmata archaeon]
MAQRGIREYHAKKMLAKYLPEFSDGKFSIPDKFALVTPEKSIDDVAKENPWIKEEKLVVKPDQLFGKRGKHGLILLNATFDQAKKWIEERMGKEVTIGKVTGKLTHFLIEPYVEHDKEYYVAIKDDRECDHIYFSTAGGVDIEENWDKVLTIDVPIDKEIDDVDVRGVISKQLSGKELDTIEEFIKSLYKFYKELFYTFLELNPFTIVDGSKIVPLDTVARLDDTAMFWMAKKWGDIEFPAPFGRELTPEEKYIKELDEKSGASLKLTILNPKGRVWTMVAGGGASVIYTDTIVDLGYGKELANYGEYSGNPTTDETYEYAKTILDLMTREKDPRGKILIIGGGIANFTDVAKTFEGIVKAIREYKDKLKEHNVKIYVRRGGPNYQEGLRMMRELGEELGIPIEVYGPELHMTRVVKLALESEGGGK